ncbi:MAG: antitoxin family protein [Acidobacteria bacterium]|nr:antitoxin family protein [Acidobacteriota bacterium]MBI3658054.1 antitoxin family protein [Acidobacteriota bacterium]
METKTVEAVYQNGNLRLLEPVDLQENEHVLVKVIKHSAVLSSQGIISGLDTDLVREVAEGDEFSIFNP